MKYKASLSKLAVQNECTNWLSEINLSVEIHDFSRPWGGFFVIAEKSKKDFVATFFPDLEIDTNAQISPKILVVKPEKLLSWQYHHRRSEIWKALNEGGVGLKRSATDMEPKEIQKLTQNEVVNLVCGERHRLIGLNEWGIVAEIWQHTDKSHLSNEDDIVRVQDDFGRS